MNCQYCEHSNSSDCNCSPIIKETSLVIPQRYLTDYLPRKKQLAKTQTNGSFDNPILCNCDTHLICHCPLYQQSCVINTHQYQRIITIPLRFRKGLKRMTTFIQYNNFADIIPTIPSKFSVEYLEAKNWQVFLRALHVPKNKSKKGILYILLENEQTDKSGWFEMEFKILAKQSHVSCFCSKCSYGTNSDRDDDHNFPLVLMPFSRFVTEMNLYSQLHPSTSIPLTKSLFFNYASHTNYPNSSTNAKHYQDAFELKTNLNNTK